MRRLLMLMVAAVSLAGLVPSAQDQRYTADDFREKRDKLASLVGDGVAVLPPARSENFFFTGLDNREVALVLIPAAAAAKAPEPEMWKTTAYLPPKSPRAGVWDDRTVAMGDDIREATGIDNTAPAGRLMADIARVAAITDTLYIPFRSVPAPDGQLPDDLRFVDAVRRMLPQVRIRNLQPLIDQVRWAKSAREIAIVKAACDITTDAFKEAARQTKPGLWEYQIDAIVNYVFRRGGSERPAFLIVGSGPNSCILHHMSNDRQMQKDELLLIDIGTVYRKLSTDLTRTIPVSGTFTPEQRKIYSIVLEAQKKAISVVRPGVTLADIHRAAFEVIDKAGYGKYFIHGTSHTLNGGSDRTGFVEGLFLPPKYPTPTFASDVRVVPGSMFTIEPGIYIPEENLGIRIEDDVLVTGTGWEVLTGAAPKEIDDIEKLMREPRSHPFRESWRSDAADTRCPRCNSLIGSHR